VNRAPVLTLWVAVCAEVQGFTYDEGLSFGKAISVHFAQAKGRSIGVIGEPTPEEAERRATRRARAAESSTHVRVFGRQLRCVRSADGQQWRALLGDTPAAPVPVAGYLNRAFGGPDTVAAVAQAMRELAQSVGAEQLQEKAYDLYCRFRPTVSAGARGWGQKGALHVDAIRRMAYERQ
jgi:hypothetical protein